MHMDLITIAAIILIVLFAVLLTFVYFEFKAELEKVSAQAEENARDVECLIDMTEGYAEALNISTKTIEGMINLEDKLVRDVKKLKAVTDCHDEDIAELQDFMDDVDEQQEVMIDIIDLLFDECHEDKKSEKKTKSCEGKCECKNKKKK